MYIVHCVAQTSMHGRPVPENLEANKCLLIIITHRQELADFILDLFKLKNIAKIIHGMNISIFL